MCFRPTAVGKLENRCLACQTVNEDSAEVCASCGKPLPKRAPPGAPGAPVAAKSPGGPPQGSFRTESPRTGVAKRHCTNVPLRIAVADLGKTETPRSPSELF